nr:hypothetical protein CFP56_61538 [Quercus suber]
MCGVASDRVELQCSKERRRWNGLRRWSCSSVLSYALYHATTPYKLAPQLHIPSLVHEHSLTEYIGFARQIDHHEDRACTLCCILLDHCYSASQCRDSQSGTESKDQTAQAANQGTATSTETETDSNTNNDPDDVNPTYGNYGHATGSGTESHHYFTNDKSPGATSNDKSKR